MCLSPGTGDGGMSQLKSSVDPAKYPDLNKISEDNFDHLALGELDEHGGLWERDTYNKAVRRFDGSVVYPWHKWQAGGEASDVDLWVAVEYNPDLDL